MKRYLSLLISVLLVLGLFSGCGASSSESAPAEAPAMEEMAANGAPDKLASAGADSSTPLPQNRKWVITSEIRAETEELDPLLEAVLQKINQLEGYVEDQNFPNGSSYGDSRMVYLTVRIPAEQVDAFLENLKEAANVIYSSQILKDITLQYTDTETRMKALRTEETRLLELMEKAETMSDLLEIEKRLTDVRYEIENVTSRLRTYDNQVDYATVYLTINEVREYTPVEQPGFLERIRTGLQRSFRGVGRGIVNFIVWLITSLPYFVIWAVVLVPAFFLIRKLRRKRKAGKKKQEDQQ